MAEYDQTYRKEISGQLRLVIGAVGLGFVFLLAIAALLKPSPYQVGTHQQLGLPPCSFLALFGIPCPTCGMTTAWTYIMHGELLKSFQSHSGGALTAMSAMVAAPWLMISAVLGRWLIWKPNGKAVAYLSMALVLISLVQWGLRLLGN